MNASTMLVVENAQWISLAIDVGLVVMAFIFMIVCAKKGFVNCVFGLLTSVAAIVAAVYFASLAVELTGGLFGVERMLIDALTSSFSNIEGFNVVLAGDANISELLASQDMSQIIANLIADNFKEVPEGYTLGMLAGETVGKYATLLLSGVALYLLFRLLLTALGKFCNFVLSGGLLGMLNRLLGAAVGLIEALIIASVAVAVLATFPSMMEILNGSVILAELYHNNPLMWLLSYFLSM